MQLPNNLFFEQVEAMLSEGNEVQLRIRGNSMRPWLRDNRDIVALTPIKTYQRSLQKGDVVLFRYRGGHILHRIVRHPGEQFILSGDGNYRITEQCCADDILAVMTRIIRPSGRIVEVSSRNWRLRSWSWRMLPAIVRKIILGVLWRVGIR